MELGATYRQRESDHGPECFGYITHPDGWRLSIDGPNLWHQRAPQRVTVAGRYPVRADGSCMYARDLMSWDERKGHEGKQRPDEMSAAMDRGAKTIARAITRRILPTVRDFTERAKKVREAGEAMQRARDEAVAIILAGVPGSQARDPVNGTVRLYPSNGPGIEVNAGGSVNFERGFHCTPQQAVAILRVLRDQELAALILEAQR